MKKFLLIIALLFAPVFALDLVPEIRDYDGLEVAVGTFIPVINLQEISTQYCPVGHRVKFAATNDLFLYETKVIPKDTVFQGFIEKRNMPVVGTNGSMKIRIDKMVLPDGFEIPVSAYVYTNTGNLIGGGLSAPVKLIAMPHYQSKFALQNRKVTLRMTPSMERKMGEHTVITAGAEGLIVIVEPLPITHTLTN
jgi:hypothetical protein